ncbi:hypothetical protein PHJA_001009900 [Phtheirospermum japonicum]|uniref:Uncharacterized protein n=1 Tax=Phtheirospermum japonicum TaxID=374723 RepID=A0A830BRK6_9LAMI|nr:hypothetical protein PHJA_001009900 [Phtheirospermum japonicum]
MAAHSNRSPSPISSRPTNPNSRSSEIYSTTRRSFNGNNSFAKPKRLDPITPANSPSEFARRRSAGSGSCLKNSEEKENNDEKDQFMKTSKLQSPAKGSKSFMAPTISAASKFTPSPRKKALVERNDPVRTSISLSDGKAMFFSNLSEDFEPKPETGYNQNLKTLAEPVQVPKPSKKVTFLDSQNANEKLSDSDSLKISSSPVSNPIAPLDADPSTRPYDPKTNYLSPRPQFLYYKPNPRLNIEKVMDIEDEIVSDNFSSDSEGTQDSEKEKLEAIASADTVIGFEDDSQLYEESEREKLEAIASADMFEGLIESLEDDLREDCVSVDSEKEKFEAIESADMVMGLNEMDVDDVIHVEQKEKKSWAFSGLMCFSMVMVMLLMAGCVSTSVTRSRPFEEFGLKDLSFSDLGNLYRQQIVAASVRAAKVDFHGLVRHINHLAVNCVSFISKVANELGEGENKIGPLKYVNLSDLQMDTWNGGHFQNNDDDEVISEIVDDNGEFDEDLDTEMANFEEEEAYAEDDDVGKDENFEDEIDEQEDDVSEFEEKMPTDCSSGLDSESSKDIQSQGEIIAVPSVSADDQLAAIIIPQDQESEFEAEIEIVPSETVEAEKSDGEIKSDLDSLTEAVQNPITSDSSSHLPPLEDKFLARYAKEITSIFAAVLAVAAAAFVVYQYKKIPSSAAIVVDVQAENKQEMLYQEKAFSSYSQREVDEDDGKIGESLCPSEMSSFQNSKREETRGGASGAQSLEGKTRRYQSKRESLASSSSEFTMGSQQPSYGSFTTFEKIPIKNAYGEEEIITPVRRSSRIRKFTSP